MQTLQKIKMLAETDWHQANTQIRESRMIVVWPQEDITGMLVGATEAGDAELLVNRGRDYLAAPFADLEDTGLTYSLEVRG